MGRRPPLPPELLSADGDKFYALLNEAEDVSAIVIGVGYIDACLASLLSKRLRKSTVTGELLDSLSGPVGSFWARSSLAYCLGLIDKPMYRDLVALAQLRNDVAHHHFAFDFSAPEVVKHCNELKYAVGLKDSASGKPLFEAAFLDAPRNRFTLSAVMIAMRLLMKALEARHAGDEV
jgi:DNA-binding MltR family transcriptional regulator